MLLSIVDSSVEYVLAYFIRERMDIFWARLAHTNPPFSDDPIFKQYKFTNVYRATDRVSQYLIRNIQYNHDWNEEDLIFRTLLFKLFNLSSTWDTLLEVLGYEPDYADFELDLYCKVFDIVQAKVPVLYNNAYMMNGKMKYGHKQKHHSHMALLKEILTADFIHQAVKCQSLTELHQLLLSQYNIGEFLAYQFAIDLNYTPIWQFDESSLYVATVGSKRGIDKLFNGNKPRSGYPSIIRFYTEHQNKLLIAHDLDAGWVNLFGRRLQAIDMQNCFCELDKYLRAFKPDIKVSTAYQPIRIKTTYKRKTEPYTLFFPPWWGLPNNQYTVS